MVRTKDEMIELTRKEILRRIDRRNNAILAVIGFPMAGMSLYGTLTGNNLFPILWGEVSIVLVLGVLYNWAIRKHRMDLRLGCVYTAVGILVSFVMISIGILGTILVVISLPFVMEGSIYSIIPLIPLGLGILVVYRVSEPRGLGVTIKQRLRMNYELSYRGLKPLSPATLYLAEKKWTNFWFYFFLYALIEVLPLFVRVSTERYLYNVVIIIGGFIILLGRAYLIQKESRKLQ